MPANSRSYGIFLDKSILAIHSGIDRANSINDPYYQEASIIFISNAWELFAKALLIKHGGDSLIYETGTKKERTITAEHAVNKLKNLGYITDLQAAPIQQIISLRNEASHTTLPEMPDELVFHLEYYAIRNFKELLDVNFKQYSKKFRKQFLSVSFGELATYADSVKKLVTKARKSKRPADLRLTYLLERGVVFSGSEYMKQADFNKILLNKGGRPLRKLGIGGYSRKADMVVVVPIQAPSGTQADIKLTKSNKGAITVKIDKRATDDDYPHLTQDLSSKVGKTRNFVTRLIKDLEIKNNPSYHQRIRTGTSSYSHKYSDACLNFIRTYLTDNPNYIPPA
jgi:hypothetical protein